MRSRLTAIVVTAAILAGGYAATVDPGGGGFSGTCLVSNRTEWTWDQCTPGTVITQTNASFSCTQAATSYGAVPIKVVILSTISWGANGSGSINFDSGCSGDGNPDTIDFIGDVEAGGPVSGIGKQADSGKLRQTPGPTNLQITGKYECGAPAAGDHPDAWQLQGGSNVALVNITTGDWDAGLATCQTAGGAVFYSTGTQTNVDVLGGKFVGCNHGLNGNNSNITQGNDVIDAQWRTGRTESAATGGDSNCAGFSPSNACINTSGLNLTNLLCQRWAPATDSWTTQTPDP